MKPDTGKMDSSSARRIVDFEKLGGMVPVIAQDNETGEVLMMAYMNQEAFSETILTGRACYFSRSRNRLWRKGEENVLADAPSRWAVHQGKVTGLTQGLPLPGTKVR